MSSSNLMVLANHLWQSTLFAVLVGCLTLLLRDNSARVRYLLWLAASAKFLLPFAWLTAVGAQIPWFPFVDAAPAPFISMADHMTAEITPFTGESVTVLTPVHHATRFLLIAVEALWALGTLVVAARWCTRWLIVRRALRESRPTDMAFVIPVMSSVQQLEPVTVGFLRPVLLIPNGLEHRLSLKEMRAVLAHERCHVVWRDNLAATFHMLVEALFWFHPLIWWLGIRLVDERERACDEHVLAAGHSPQSYAEGILKVCEYYLAPRLDCVASISGANLKQRIERILKDPLIQKLSAVRKLVLAVCLCATIAVPIAVGLGWETYKTTIGGIMQMVLSDDGSEVTLGTSTQMRMRITRARRDIVLDRGQVSFQGESQHSIFVKAENAVVRAVGASFSVRIRDDHRVEVLVTQGQVALSAVDTSQPAVLPPSAAVSRGEVAIVSDAGVAVKRMPSAEIASSLAGGGIRRHYDITAGDVRSQLNEFSRQANTQFLFDFHQLEGLKAGRLLGDYGISQALTELLDGLPLEWSWVSGSTIAVRRMDISPRQGKNTGDSAQGSPSPQTDEPSGRLLRFQGDTLAHVVAEYNRYNRRRMVLEDPLIADLRIGGVFLATDPDSFVNALGQMGISARAEGTEEGTGSGTIHLSRAQTRR